MRPSEFSRWSEQDQGLAEALVMWEDSLCGGCGEPRERAWSPLSEGEYEGAENTCQACAALDRQRKAGEDRPGRYVTVHHTDPTPPD